MQALVYMAPRAVELRDWAEPRPASGQVLIRVHAAAICGSDLHGYLGHSKIRIPPMVMGHEFAGEIVAVGEGVRELSVGDRVTAQPLVNCGHCIYCREGR